MSDPATPAPDTRDWTVVLTDGCPECGFDPAYDERTTGSWVRASLPRWQAVLERPDATQRPAPEVWSPTEYAAHVVDVFLLFRARLELMVADDAPADGARFDNWDQDETALARRYWERDPAEVAGEIAVAGTALADAFDAVPADRWDRVGLRSNGSVFTTASFAAYLRHDVEHHLGDVAG
jgi:hypothetical protein